MEIKLTNVLFPNGNGLLKLIMRTFIFLLCTTVFSFNTEIGFSQEQVKIDTDKTVSVDEVFIMIQQQTKYRFLYPQDLFKDLPKVQLKKGSIRADKLINQSISGARFNVIVSADNTILIKEAKTQKQIKVTGKVTDEKGLPVIGVTVLIKGTVNGTATDFDGAFSITVPNRENVLVFSALGFATQEITVGNQTVIDVVLKEAVSTLEEVTLFSTGYQTISKERAAGAFDIVDRKILDQRPVSDLSAALQGTVAGLQATENPDGTMSFLIRGVGTIYGSREPLIVIDGFPVASGDFSNINPNDVESVTVLKDAAAASIWGSRAANGVIVITTKTAKGKGFSLEANTFTRISNKLDLDQGLNQASSAEQIALERMIHERELWFSEYTPGFSSNSMRNALSQGQELLYRNRYGEISDAQMNRGLDSLASINNRNQLNKYFLQNAVTNQVTLNVSGATDKLQTYGSFLYEGSQGAIANNGYDRYLINFKNEFEVSHRLKLSFGANIQYKESEDSGATLGEISGISPYETFVDANGNYIDQTYLRNRQEISNLPLENFPYSDWSYNLLRETRGREIKNENLDVRAQVGLNFKLFDGIDFDSRLQVEKIQRETNNYHNEDTYYVRDMVNNYVDYDNMTGMVNDQFLPTGGILRSNTAKLDSYVFRNQLNINKNFSEDFLLNAVIGNEISSYLSTGSIYPYLYGYDPKTDQSTLPPYGYGSNQVFFSNFVGDQWLSLPGGNTERDWHKDKYLSFYGNASLSYKNKYTVTGSARSDGSNFITDDSGLRWSPLWSIGGLWNISNESFIAENATFIDFIRMRLTYGKNGNSETSTSTNPLLNVSPNPSTTTGTITATIADNGNPLLRWERTTTTNLGFDYSFFQRKLFGKIDLYNKHGEDIMGNILLASTTGTTSQRFNNAEILNRGIEVELGTNMGIGSFQWNTSMNYAYNYNEVKNLFYPSYLVRERLGAGAVGTPVPVEGYPLNPIFSLNYLGMIDGIGHVEGPDGNPYPMHQIQILSEQGNFLNYEGTAIPPHTFGWMNNIKGYGFDLMVLITGKFGGVFREPTFNYYGVTFNPGTANRFLADVLNEDPNIPAMPLTYQTVPQNVEYLNTLIASSSYIELNEINLQYSFPAQIVNNLNLNNLKVFAQVRNLGMLWQANDRGFHPEWLPGTWRPTPSFTFGLNIKF